MTQIERGHLTDKGTRDHNEDHYLIPPQLTTEQLSAKGQLYVVADGVGGHQAGEVASQMATSVVMQEYYQHAGGIQEALRYAVEEANRKIFREANQNSQRQGMACTVVAAVLHNNQVILANVGDSRTYRIRQGQIEQLTLDHAWVDEQVRAGVLTKEEARHHPQRNVVTRSVGSEFEVQVDIYPPQPILDGDSLILCSDGLNAVLEDQYIAQIVLQSRNAQEAAQQLVQATLNGGAPDNVTTIVLHIGQRQPVAIGPKVVPGGGGGNVNPALIFGIFAVLIAVGLVVVGFLFTPPTTQPPTPALVQGDPNNVAAVAETPTLGPPPEIQLDENSGEPTPTPDQQLALNQPPPNAQFQPGEAIELSWDWSGQASNFRVVVQGQQGGVADEKLSEPRFTVGPLPPGQYSWLVTVSDAEEVEVARAAPSQFVVLAPPTPTPTPTSAPADTATENEGVTGSPVSNPPPGNQSSASNPPPASLAAPALQSPAEGVTFDSTVDVELSWADVNLPAEHYYVLRIQHEEGYDYTPLAESKYLLRTAGKEWLLEKTFPNSELHWWVAIAIDETQFDPEQGPPPDTLASNWSEQRTFVWTKVGTGGGGSEEDCDPSDVGCGGGGRN